PGHLSIITFDWRLQVSDGDKKRGLVILLAYFFRYDAPHK
ncbi:MAG: hypothetical protein ACI81A_002897, partial [Paraglaciecola sp.]